MRRIFIREIPILLGLALLPAIGQAFHYRERVSWNAPLRAGEEASVGQAQSWGENVLWVDARPAEEYERERVPGAVLLNEDRWNELLPQMLSVWSPEKRIVVYCNSKSCGASREVARRLREEAQLNNVFVLEGGWEAWRAQKR